MAAATASGSTAVPIMPIMKPIHVSRQCSAAFVMTSPCDRRRGRDAGDPAPPAQSRTGSVPASGSSVGLASAQDAPSSIHSSAPGRSNAGARDGDGVEPRDDTRPADALPLPATPIAPLTRTGHGPVKKALEGTGGALDAIVAVMASQPSIEPGEEGWSGPVPSRLTPFLEPLARPLPLLARGAALDARHALSVFLPVTVEAQHGEPPPHARMEATEAQNAGLLRCHLQVAFGCLGATEHKTGLSHASNPEVPNYIPF
jgi:hypothetical protein